MFLKEERNVDRDTGRMPCDDRGRDCSDASTSQGMPVIVGDHQKPREAWDGFSLGASRGLRPADTLISDFWLSEL